jgi:peptidoglycan/LPS O-acetylase OafA/YrhL
MRLEKLAAGTPASRDRYVDFLRAFSILVVVFGHWFIALIWREGGEIGVHNAIGVTRGLWLATWLFQVMPVFFFVGGFSNLKTYEAMRARGESLSDFFRVRFERLLQPTAVFVVIWLAISRALPGRRRGDRHHSRGNAPVRSPLVPARLSRGDPPDSADGNASSSGWGFRSAP